MHENSNDLIIERLNTLNIKDIGQLYHSVYGRSVTDNFFQKKYDTSYIGQTNIGFLAYTSERVLIGFFGAIPCYVNCDGNKILAVQSVDAMIHSDYRFKGLFVKLGELTYDLCKRSGIQFVFGFPNQNSQPGLVNKLGWKMIGSMDRFTIPVRTVPLYKIAQRMPFLNKPYQFYQNRVLRKYTRDSRKQKEALFAEKNYAICRSNDYILYKSYNNNFFINIRDTVLWIRIQNALVIGDMIVPENDFWKIINKLKRIAFWMGVDTINFQTSPDTLLHKRLSEKYKASPSFHIGVKDFGSNVFFEKFSFSYADIDIF